MSIEYAVETRLASSRCRAHRASRRLRLAAALSALWWCPAPLVWPCTIERTHMNIGAYDTLDPSATSSTSTIDVTCPVLTSYTIELSTGNGSYAQREMLGAAAALKYNLYRDESHSVVWGDGSDGSESAQGTAGLTPQVHTVYGLVPPQQNVTAGAYNDEIVVTVIF